MTLALAAVTRLEKAAVDSGFDRELPRSGDWLRYASTHASLEVWLTVSDGGVIIVGLSERRVARALAEMGVDAATALPPGVCAARSVADIPSLHLFLRRAYQLSRTLPDALLHAFEKKTATLPKTTEAERLIVQRVGQGLFRAGLLEYWDGRCAITGLHVPALLRASHIKPWSDCATDAERLDVFNGLLLAPNLDAAFDGGFITIADDGAVLIADQLAQDDRALLGLDGSLRVQRLAAGHRLFLPWHRERVFKGA